MSDSTDGTAPAAPDDGVTVTSAPAPSYSVTPSDAQNEPADEQSGPEAPGDPAPESDPARDPSAKRINRLTGRLTWAMRQNADLQARVAQLEAGGRTPADSEHAQAVQAEAARLVAEQRTADRIAAFHEAGRDAYPDWQQRCEALMAMGADAPFSALLVEMKDGPRIVAALHDDPDELERITKLPTPTQRATALGIYAGRLEATGNPARGAAGSANAVTPGRAVSRAPAPIRPVSGRANPTFDEYRAGNSSDGNAALVAYYEKQDRIARGLPG